VRTTIERIEPTHATVPGQRSGIEGSAPDGFAAQLVDALGRLGPALGPTDEARSRARARIGALLAAGPVS
jgi:hypothetical protein